MSYQDPGLDPVILAAANHRHDQEQHSVCMKPWVQYRGRPTPRDAAMGFRGKRQSRQRFINGFFTATPSEP